MPKRKRECTKSDTPKTSDNPIVMTLWERWIVATFNSIREFIMPPQLEERITMLSSSINDPNTGRRRVDYRAGKFKQGRLYGEGLQSIKRAVRRLCSHEYYIDLDIKIAGPCLFVQLLAKQGIAVPHLLQLYADDRNRMF